MDYIHRDRSLLKHAVRELEEYILSDQLFWPLDTGERLTLGSLLLALHRFPAYAKSPEEKQILNDAYNQIVTLRGKWRTNWSNKATLEFHSRLRQWELALRELFSEEQNRPVIYSQEVTLRVILTLLQSELLQSDIPAYERLAVLDKQLRAASHQTDFIWDSALKDQFPKDKFWFLYCTPTPGE